MPLAPPLACTVRTCGLLLERSDGAYTCARGHSYDVARRGYVNLLQPHDRRSRAPGDAPEAVAARARLLSMGIGRGILLRVAEVAERGMTADSVVADLGSGSGELLAAIRARLPLTAIGIDLSAAAVEHAARHYPDVLWIAANADRRLPLLDGSVDAVISMHGRRNPAECARVLAHDGHLIVALPAPDDLIELRTVVQGQGLQRERTDAMIAEHAAHFGVLERAEHRERHRLDPQALRDVLRGTYRGERHSAVAAIQALAHLDVTFASDVVVFRRT